jgi:hypothetical protein
VFCFILFLSSFVGNILVIDVRAQVTQVRCPIGSHRSPDGDCGLLLNPISNISELGTPAPTQSMLDFESSNKPTMLTISAESSNISVFLAR